MSNEKNSSAMTDGFHLVVTALKLNGLDTIYCVAGIPITDLARLAQAEGIRYIGFRHEQSGRERGYNCGLSHQETRDLPYSIGPRVSKWDGRAGQCRYQRLPDDPDQRVQRPRDR